MKLPDKIFGQEVDGAYKKYLVRTKNQKPKPVEQESVVKPANLEDPQNFIIIPKTNILIAKIEPDEFKGLNWKDTHIKLAENGLFMPTPKLFMQYFTDVINAYNGNQKLYDGSNKELTRKEIEDIYKHLTTDHINGGAWSWLDAKFVEGSGALGLDILTNHKIVNDTFQSKNRNNLEACIEDDCYVGLGFNKQGLPIHGTADQEYKQGENIYFYYPRKDYVAGFVANSGRALLYCDWNPGGSLSVLGVFACAVGRVARLG